MPAAADAGVTPFGASLVDLAAFRGAEPAFAPTVRFLIGALVADRAAPFFFVMIAPARYAEIIDRSSTQEQAEYSLKAVM